MVSDYAKLEDISTFEHCKLDRAAYDHAYWRLWKYADEWVQYE